MIRFRVREGEGVSFEDGVRGLVSIATEDIDDFVLIRSNGYPTYNLSVVIDDHAGGVTHVIRGEDHISNTPKQILLCAALGYPIPVFAHLSMIHGEDGTKLSKRHGATDVLDYREMGYLPEALLNFLLRLGFHTATKSSLHQRRWWTPFPLQGFPNPAPFLALTNSHWINHEKLRAKSAEEIDALLSKNPAWDEALQPFQNARVDFIRLYQSRAETLLDYVQFAKTIAQKPNYTPELLKAWRGGDSDKALYELHETLLTFEPFEAGALSALIKSTVQRHKLPFAKVGRPLRIALIGTDSAPDSGALIALLSRDEARARLLAYLLHPL